LLSPVLRHDPGSRRRKRRLAFEQGVPRHSGRSERSNSGPQAVSPVPNDRGAFIFQNYFIRNYLWSFLGGQIINLAATIGYILRGNQGRTSLDL